MGYVRVWNKEMTEVLYTNIDGITKSEAYSVDPETGTRHICEVEQETILGAKSFDSMKFWRAVGCVGDECRCEQCRRGDEE